ncbi:hypothetical protein V1478_015678 [Vespula squamosa]|uniref:Uncharacterized protein n=1 Tax=Vespula squamosa TaxID=30214 RepID=A0ABD2A1M5_VESSQ
MIHKYIQEDICDFKLSLCLKYFLSTLEVPVYLLVRVYFGYFEYVTGIAYIQHKSRKKNGSSHLPLETDLRRTGRKDNIDKKKKDLQAIFRLN